MLALARRRHGLITHGELLGLGLTRNAIASWCRHGRLIRVHRGVYALGRPPQTPVEWAAAAVLACGPGALLSHSSALALWGFSSRWPRPPHVIARTDRRRPGIIVHRARELTPADRRRHLGLAVTSPARTILDCAPERPLKELARIVADARRSGQARRSNLEDVIARFGSHPGRRPLLAVLEGDHNPTRSALEDDFLAFCRRYALPLPLVNVHVAGHEVDALFPGERVIVELDGFQFHRDRHVFEADRARDADTLEAGHVTVRLTPTRLSDAPEAEARRLHAILAQRRR